MGKIDTGAYRLIDSDGRMQPQIDGLALRDLAVDGIISPETPIYHVRREETVKAEDIPILAAYFVTVALPNTEPSVSTDEKTCPFCAERVKGDAVVCKHCRHSLVASVPPDVNTATKTSFVADTISTQVEDPTTARVSPGVGTAPETVSPRSPLAAANLGAAQSPRDAEEKAEKSLDAPHASPRGAGRLGVRSLLGAFLPNRVLSPGAMRALALAELGVFFLVWLNSPFKVLPRPLEVWTQLAKLWTEQGLGPELWTSFRLNAEALGWTTLISLSLSYLTVLPVFRPLAAAVSKGRFLSLAGFSFLFTLVMGGGRPLQLWMLVAGMTVFFVTSMASVVVSIPKSEFDHARTLRMSEWRVVWEVVILGTLDRAFDVLRQNAAIGWTLLTFVEGIVRAEGGAGALLLNQQKYFNLPGIFAIQLVILLLGLFQDYVIGAVRRLACPYADLTLERKEG